ncbi:unnamed protein product [Schistosoma haematobium]|nr:unnamed protein product [Schistosoma haematobium]
MEVQCISKNEIKPNGWSTKTCHYPYSNSHSINHDCNLEQETSQYKLMNTNGIHQNNNDISTMLTNHSYLKSNLLPINDSSISNEISPTRNTDNSNNNNKNGDDDGDVDVDQYLPSIMNKQKSLFVSIGIQTDDQLISKCCNKEILSNDNLSNISYFCDKNDTNTTHDNNNNNNNNVESLIDAIKCVYAEVKIEQAEMIINNLIEKFAEPSDMYTSVENLPKDNLLFCNIHSDNNNNNDNNKKSLLNENSSNPPHTSVSFFSPIFKLLLTQSESQIFPDLYKLSPSGRKLYDLCHRLAFDIRRTKNKLRILQKMRTKQSNQHHFNVRITSTNPNTTTLTTDSTNISTHNTSNNILSNFQKFLDINESDSLNSSVKISQDNRRNAFIHYLHDISRNYEMPKSTLTTKTISNHNDPGQFQQLCKDSQLLTHHYHYCEHNNNNNSNNENQSEKYGNYLEQIITSNSIIPPTTNSNMSHRSTAPTYTNPLNCPLSLLSFVSNLNKVSRVEEITDNNDSEDKKEGEEAKEVKGDRRQRRSRGQRQCRRQQSKQQNQQHHHQHRQRKKLQVNEKFRQNKQKFPSLSDNNNNDKSKKADCETLSIPFSSLVSSPSPLSPSLSSISVCTTNNNNNNNINNNNNNNNSLNLKHDLTTNSTGICNLNMANVSTMSTNDLTTNKSNINDLPSKLTSSICSANYSNNYHHVESSCSLNVPALSPSILCSSLCSASSSDQISTTITPSSHLHQDNPYRGKRRQVSSPLEEHNKLNNENDFIQTPSKNRRCSSFNSQKYLINKQFTESLDNNNSNNSSASPLIHDTMSLCSPQMNTNLMLNSKFFFPEKNSNKLTHCIKSNRSRKDSQLSSSSSNRTMECTVNSLISPTHTISTGATSVMSLRSPSPPPSLQTPVTMAGLNHMSSDKYMSECSDNNNNNDNDNNINNKSEKVIYPLNNHLSEEFNADNISISSTITTTDSSNECLSWQVYEKFKRRKQGCIYCRSIIRDVDGLIVKVGDCVQFGSGRNEIYLGEVKEIRWEQKRNSLIVVAAWYYQPLEAGKDGQLVQDIKGALFTTEHKDENEAKCIKRRIKIAKSYGQFMQGYYGKPKGQDSVKSSQTQLDKNMGEFTPSTDTEQINLEACEPLPSSSLTSTSHSIKDPSIKENDTNQPPKLQITLNNNDNKNEISSDDNEDDDDDIIIILISIIILLLVNMTQLDNKYLHGIQN